MSGRSGEDDKMHFRSTRFEQSNGQWYYLTRGGVQHGPYANREAAERELKFFLREIGNYEERPGRDDFEAIEEKNRKYGALEDKYPGS
ncbi:MAG: hypothetical protein ACI9GW_001300 [Halieaceae bacterium]|jgi:hypothetical protein